jgi:hypothetical protein
MTKYSITLLLFLFTLTHPLTVHAQLILNEIYASPPSGEPEWLEIYNPTDIPIPLKDWQIAENQSGVIKNHELITSDQESTLAAKSFYVLVPNKVSLNNSGDTIYLYANPDQQADVITYPKLTSAQSYARQTDSLSHWEITTILTPNATNNFPTPTPTPSATSVPSTPTPTPTPAASTPIINITNPSTPTPTPTPTPSPTTTPLATTVTLKKMQTPATITNFLPPTTTTSASLSATTNHSPTLATHPQSSSPPTTIFILGITAIIISLLLIIISSFTSALEKLILEKFTHDQNYSPQNLSPPPPTFPHF